MSVEAQLSVSHGAEGHKRACRDFISALITVDTDRPAWMSRPRRRCVFTFCCGNKKWHRITRPSMTRGWHGSEFSNLSRPTPTKINLFPSQSHKNESLPVPIPRKNWGVNPVPFHSRKNDSHSLPLPCRVFFIYCFFCRNLSVTVKI